MKMVCALRFIERDVPTDRGTMTRAKILQQRIGDTDFPFNEPDDWEDVLLVNDSNDGK